MIRKSIVASIVLGFCLVCASQTRAQMKVGTVDMDRIFKEFSKTKEAEAKINEAKNAAKKEYEERANAYKTVLDEINKINAQVDAPALSAEAKSLKAKDRDEKIEKIKKMEREINEFRQTREQQLQQQMLRMREGIVKEITDVVMERVKTNKMDLVFDKSGASMNGFSPLLFSRESGDFTTDIIAALNGKEREPNGASSEKSAASPPASSASPSLGNGNPAKP